MPATRLKRFLDDHGVRYVSIPHYPTYTAQETAASAHLRGREVAKTVMVTLDGTMAMVVLPATRRLDLARLEAAAGARQATLATEREFKDMFPDCDVGAMPPFGNLYGLRVFVDQSLAEDEHIAFNAGTHDELIQIDYRDFERLVEPTVASLAYERPVTV
jgi:Ala-tRNA(Pro) deacylase